MTQVEIGNIVERREKRTKKKERQREREIERNACTSPIVIKLMDLCS